MKPVSVIAGLLLLWGGIAPIQAAPPEQEEPSAACEALEEEARLLLRQGQTAGTSALFEAVARLEEMRTCYRDLGDEDNEIKALISIGFVYRVLSENKRSLDTLQEALQIAQASNNQIQQSKIFHNLGAHYSQVGQFAEAFDYFRQSLALSRALEDRQQEAQTLHATGAAYDRSGQSEQAVEHFSEALEINRALQNVQEMAVNLNSLGVVYQNMGQSEEAFFVSERGRNRAFLNALVAGQIRLNDSEAADLLEQEQTLFTHRQILRVDLAQARLAEPAQPDRVAALEDELAEIEAEYTAVQTALADGWPRLAALLPQPNSDYVLDVPRLQALLDEETTLISYYFLNWRWGHTTLAFVITPDDFQTVVLEGDWREIRQAVLDFRDFANLEEAHPESLVRLYDWLIEPVEEHLDTSHLAIVPHNILHYLPFAALTDGERYLGDDYTLTTLPDASVLPFIQENAAKSTTKTGASPSQTGSPALVIGNALAPDDANDGWLTVGESFGLPSGSP